MALRALERECREPCHFLLGLDTSGAAVNCWKRCISPTCYEEVYGKDPVSGRGGRARAASGRLPFSPQFEDGEIDDRLNAFKQCFFRVAGKG
jgi:hypothetical protein